MDKNIRIEINGSYIRKDNKVGGVQGEGNISTMHLIFDDSWSGLAKKITFWNAKGLNPVERTLTADLLTDITVSTLDYSVLIPSEPLEFDGEFTYVIDGYIDGTRQRSVADTLTVRYSPVANNAGEPVDPTPTQAEQLQVQIDTLLGDIQDERILSQEAAESATASAQTASTKAAEASVSAGSALTSAQTATAKAGEAANSATIASSAATTATAKAAAAEDSASEAAASATSAAGSAATATTKASEASTSAINAAASKDTALTAATNASASESAAAASKTAAASSASSASTSAGTATTKATEAATSAIEAKSYAVGGTGSRVGEDTDNAKYYKDQAQAIVGGDYVTNVEFASRVNDVVLPLANDINILQGEIDLLEDRVTENENDIESINAEISALKYADINIEARLNETASLASSTWDAVFNDVTENPAIINFDDLTGITLTGGVWNKPLQRLEV